jgi:nucleoside 2-deoxyribosyltransferase
MKIYFAASIRGGRDLQATYQAIVEHLKQSGHEVLSENVAFETMAEQGISDEAIYTQDTAWLDECDVVVAEVTTPSLGVGYEIGFALHKAHKPVLCLCHADTHLSAMLHGNTNSGLRIVFYDDLPQGMAEIDQFLVRNRKGAGRMPKKIRISSGSIHVEAELNDQPTARAVWDVLPIDARALTWGDEVYFDIPVEMGLEPDARAEVAVGELGYWPTGNAFCIFFGPTPASSGQTPVAASPVNILGRVAGDVTVFRAVRRGDTVRIEAGG